MKIHLKWSTAREVAETGDVVQPGESADFPKDLADRLLDQPDVWGKGSAPKSKKSDEDSEES